MSNVVFRGFNSSEIEVIPNYEDGRIEILIDDAYVDLPIPLAIGFSKELRKAIAELKNDSHV